MALFRNRAKSAENRLRWSAQLSLTGQIHVYASGALSGLRQYPLTWTRESANYVRYDTLDVHK